MKPDNTPADELCGYPFFYTGYNDDSVTMYSTLNDELNFRNETNTITVNGSAITKKAFTLSNIDKVNRFLKSDAKYATIIETDVGANTSVTDSVAALNNNSIAST